MSKIIRQCSQAGCTKIAGDPSQPDGGPEPCRYYCLEHCDADFGEGGPHLDPPQEIAGGEIDAMQAASQALAHLDRDAKIRALKFLVAHTLGWPWVRFQKTVTVLTEQPTGEVV